MARLDFSSSDHVDAARFNRLLWDGLKGEDTPYPTTRSGRDLRKNRRRLLSEAIREEAKKKQQTARDSEASGTENPAERSGSSSSK
jgi:hypothetical protein